MGKRSYKKGASRGNGGRGQTVFATVAVDEEQAVYEARRRKQRTPKDTGRPTPPVTLARIKWLEKAL